MSTSYAPILRECTEDPCKKCFYYGNIKDPCPENAKLPLAKTKEELIERLRDPFVPPLNCGSMIFIDDIKNEEIANYILKLKADGYKTMRDTEEVYSYEEGIYKPNGEIEIKALIEKLYPKATTHNINEVIAHIQRRTYVNREDFDKDIYLVTLKNGILDIRTGLLNEFTTNYLSLSKLNVTYDPSAKCPAIEKFLSEVVAPEDLITLYEIASYLLIKRYFIHKAIMLVGDTHAGKDTYQKLLCSLIGARNVTHRPLQELITDKFAKADLFGKLLNSFSDLPNAALRQTGIFKGLCGESPTSGQRKFKDSFDFENYAKLVFSCNEMPKTYDKGDSFFIRWIIINFPNRFDDNNPNTDKFLIDKITSEEELAGLLNKLIEYAKKLLENQHFTNNPHVDEIRAYYERLSNPIFAFIDETCSIEPDANITKKDFYQALMKYCEDKRLSKPTLTYTTQEMKRLRYEEYKTSEGQTAYKGLRFKNDNEKKEKVNLDDLL